MLPDTFRWTVEIEVSRNWIEDGFNLSAAELRDAILATLLRDAYHSEVGVRVLKRPRPDTILAAQSLTPEERNP